MNVAREIVLRYRAHGHVRFQLPEALCSAPSREHLVSALQQVEGIYRVDLAPSRRKLSLRFLEHIVPIDDIAKALKSAANSAALAEPVQSSVPPTGTASSLEMRWAKLRPVAWLRAKIQEGRETAAALRVLSRRPEIRRRIGSVTSEEILVPLLNDALLFFLVKLHWPMISQQWSRQPWRHRYEWLATGYMLFLYARSRRPAAPKLEALR